MADDPKLAEFRDKNIALMKEIDDLKAKYDGIDPVAVAADRAKLAEFVKAKPDARIAELEAALATEQAARTEAQRKADTHRVRDTLRAKGLAAGVLPAALDMFLDKAEPVFTLVNDTVQARADKFSKSRPGELITPDEWTTDAIRAFPFLFAKSSGGGAAPKSGLFSGSSSQKQLVDPSPQQLGQHAAAIAKGELKVVYSNEQ